MIVLFKCLILTLSVCGCGGNSGSAGDVLEDDPVGRLKVYIYELPTKYNKKMVAKDSR
jgi:hypothetical protein